MDARAIKLALARQKLKSHQDKKSSDHKEEPTIDYNNDSSKTANTENTELSLASDHQQAFDNEKKLREHSKEISNLDPHNSSSNVRDASIDSIDTTEILVSSKRNLELQVCELQTKLSQLENNYALAINNNDNCKQHINNLEFEYKRLQNKYEIACEEIALKDKKIADFNTLKSKICDENNLLLEQLDFAKSLLTEKESENASLSIELKDLHKQLDAAQLQLRQLSNGAQVQLSNHIQREHVTTEHNTEVMLQKISNLELLLKTSQKEKDQINSHYEHYVNELNEQLKLTISKNHELSIQVQNLSTRENELIEQVGDMERRIQNVSYQPLSERSQLYNIESNNAMKELQENYKTLQEQLKKLSTEYQYLQQEYDKSKERVEQLKEVKAPECGHDKISLSKLTADIANDKVAAQRATEQNKKMKVDIMELEEAFVKISKDKLELTEKVAAEKYLNRELTIKLAEIEDQSKEMYKKLLAKDEEMIRLQNNIRKLENDILDKSVKLEKHDSLSKVNNKEVADKTEPALICNDSDLIPTRDQHECLFTSNADNNSRIRKEDAMVKLQDRFLKIMEEVADLSDEKHRLEHIILQLQNETDTICEYVALYQQQRSLLKKRDEERSAQIKLFQSECDRLKSQLEELSNIIFKLSQDTELVAYFKIEPRQSELAKVIMLLSKLKNNTLIDTKKTSSELNNFYPCSCCSGTLIDV